VSYFRQLVDGECVYVNTTIKTEARYVNTKLWKTDLPKPILTLFTTFNIEMQQRIVYGLKASRKLCIFGFVNVDVLA
jgi:hypothetical protein